MVTVQSSTGDHYGKVLIDMTMNYSHGELFSL